LLTALASLATVALLGAADAGRARDHTDARWVTSRPLNCTDDLIPPETELRFETIDSRTADWRTPDLIAGSGMVQFQWNAITGELSFTTGAAVSPITLPEDFVKVAAKAALTSCGSR
jgi:hypothetical protein